MSEPGTRLESAPVARNALFALGSHAATVAITAALSIYLVRALGPGDYGIFALAVGFGALVLLLADFGVTASASRFIAEHGGERRAVAATVAAALRLKLPITGAAALVVVVLAGPIADAYDAPAMAEPLRWIALSLFGQSLMLMAAGTFIALGRVSLQFRLVALESLVELTATVLLVALASGAAAASAGRAAGYVFGAVLGLSMVLRMLGRGALPTRSSGQGPGVRRLLGYAGALLIVDGAFAAFSQVDVLLVGALLGPVAAGIYGAPIRLVTVLHYPGLAIANAVAPRLAASGPRRPDPAPFMLALRWLIVGQAALAAGIMVWAEPITTLVLGDGYERSAEVLRALGPLILMSGLGPLVSVGVNYLGEARRRIPIAIGALLLNVVLGYALIEATGVVGAALALDVAYAAYLGGHLWLCRRLLGISLAPLAGALVRSLPPAAALAAVLWAFGTESIGPLAWVAGAACGMLAFGSVALATRAVTLDDVQAFRNAIRSAATRTG